MSRIVSLCPDGRRMVLSELRCAIEGLRALSVTNCVQARPTLDRKIEELERIYLAVWIEFSPMPFSASWLSRDDDENDDPDFPF
jgi:hypothetical protein